MGKILIYSATFLLFFAVIFNQGFFRQHSKTKNISNGGYTWDVFLNKDLKNVIIDGKSLIKVFEPNSLLINNKVNENFINNNKLLDDRFLIVGDVPKEKLNKFIKDFKSNNIDPNKILITKEPTNQKNIKNLSLTDKISLSLAVSNNNNSGSSVKWPGVPDDQFCDFNTSNTQQCGGGFIDNSQPHSLCKAKVTVPFDFSCNYGNYPEYSSQYPTPPGYTDPGEQCTSVRKSNCCACNPATTVKECGQVLHCFVPDASGGCSNILPVTCEQCCAGQAWIWDAVSGGCGCANSG